MKLRDIDSLDGLKEALVQSGSDATDGIELVEVLFDGFDVTVTYGDSTFGVDGDKYASIMGEDGELFKLLFRVNEDFTSQILDDDATIFALYLLATGRREVKYFETLD